MFSWAIAFFVIALIAAVFGFFRPKVAPPVPDLPIPFGYNCAWLAIRSASVLEAALALRLRRAEAANWANGLGRAQAGEMFVSPAVGGWAEEALRELRLG